MWRERLTSEGTNHDDTGTETLGGEGAEANLGSDLAGALALVGGLAHKGHERVGRVGDDGADDTGEVAGREGDAELRRLPVRVLRRREDVLVEHADDVLEEEELRHRGGDLQIG